MYYGRKAEPRANKLLHEAELRHRAELHQKKLRASKPSVDMSAPKGFGQARRNLKREQMLEDRYSKIEHENRLLLSRMSEIMTRPQGGGAAPGGGGVDNVSTSWQYGRSLNTVNRRRELERITKENQAILHRIRGVVPVYNHFEWEESAAQGERLAESISEFHRLPITGTAGGAAAAAARRSPSGFARSGVSDAGGGSVEHGLGGSGAGAGALHLSQLGSGAGGGLMPPSSAPAGGGWAAMGVAPGSSAMGLGAGGSASYYGGMGASAGAGAAAGGGFASRPPGSSGFTMPGGLGALPTPGAGAGAGFSLGTPGGTQLGALGPAAQQLLAQYGYGQVPLGGAGVPASLAPAYSAPGTASALYPRVNAPAGGYGSTGAAGGGVSAPGSVDVSKYLQGLSMGSGMGTGSLASAAGLPPAKTAL